jgi:cytochrome P450
VNAGADFDPSSLGRERDPYAQLAELRTLGPVVRLASGFWAVTGYDAILEVLRDRACASGPIAARYVAALPAGAARDEMSHRVNFLDPPDHTRVRSLVSKAFTPRRIEALLPWIAATAERLADGIPTHAPFDLLQVFAHQLPSLVISELLGVPAEDRDRLTAWSDAVAPLLALELSDEDRARALDASEAFHAYLGTLLEARRRTPGDDLLSALVVAEEDGDRLSRAELLSLAATLYSAGHRTTRDLFTNGMATLLTHDLYGDVVARRFAPAAIVEEFLRYVTPTLFVVRIPTAPVVVQGVTVGAWEPILVYLAAGNRDPAAFTRPDEFRPDRRERDTLSFAHGAHFCLGASLARVEARIMLETATAHWPRLALDADAPPLRWHQRGPFRGLDALVVGGGGGGPPPPPTTPSSRSGRAAPRRGHAGRTGWPSPPGPGG